MYEGICRIDDTKDENRRFQFDCVNYNFVMWHTCLVLSNYHFRDLELFFRCLNIVRVYRNIVCAKKASKGSDSLLRRTVSVRFCSSSTVKILDLIYFRV